MRLELLSVWGYWLSNIFSLGTYSKMLLSDWGEGEGEIVLIRRIPVLCTLTWCHAKWALD